MNRENPGSDHRQASKKFNELLQGGSSLAEEIQKKSRVQITEGTAKRLVSDLKKKQKSPTASGKGKIEPGQSRAADSSVQLTQKDRKKLEKLKGQLLATRNVISLLEEKLKKAKKGEKSVLDQLERPGQAPPGHPWPPAHWSIRGTSDGYLTEGMRISFVARIL
ncbi:MAG: hypothetical protein CMN76_09575 [Spirochaetaceae bacterium]|nr:hypothetical protein [Spirochaetaceae bacterium]|tara:strand:+ start:81942 stop:82433 length:492 start_codon:yes stop_codon:yes gene_type:complete